MVIRSTANKYTEWHAWIPSLVPNELALYAGHVLLGWSTVEHNFDLKIDQFIKATQSAKPTGLDRMSFEKRRAFFRGEARKLFPNNPAIVEVMRELSHQ